MEVYPMPDWVGHRTFSSLLEDNIGLSEAKRCKG